MQPIIVQKGKTIELPVSLGFDVSQDGFVSQIRTTQSDSSALIATWTIIFVTDGSDGELLLTLLSTITTNISNANGYMTLKRVSGGAPLSVFSEPVAVVFINP